MDIKPCPNGARGMLYAPASQSAKMFINSCCFLCETVTPSCNLHVACRIKFRSALQRACSSSVVRASEIELGGQTARTGKRAFFSSLS